MKRIVSLVVVLAVVLAFAATAEAGKKKKKKDQASTVVGTVTAVDEGKSITVTGLGGKKKKKAAPATTIKITDKTKIDYIGIKDENERKLSIGQVVIVALDEANRDTATAIAAGKLSEAKKNKSARGKKKKKNEQ
jgi:hypothetical protein